MDRFNLGAMQKQLPREDRTIVMVTNLDNKSQYDLDQIEAGITDFYGATQFKLRTNSNGRPYALVHFNSRREADEVIAALDNQPRFFLKLEIYQNPLLPSRETGQEQMSGHFRQDSAQLTGFGRVPSASPQNFGEEHRSRQDPAMRGHQGSYPGPHFPNYSNPGPQFQHQGSGNFAHSYPGQQMYNNQSVVQQPRQSNPMQEQFVQQQTRDSGPFSRQNVGDLRGALTGPSLQYPPTVSPSHQHFAENPKHPATQQSRQTFPEGQRAAFPRHQAGTNFRAQRSRGFSENERSPGQGRGSQSANRPDNIQHPGQHAGRDSFSLRNQNVPTDWKPPNRSPSSNQNQNHAHQGFKQERNEARDQNFSHGRQGNKTFPKSASSFLDKPREDDLSSRTSPHKFQGNAGFRNVPGVGRGRRLLEKAEAAPESWDEEDNRKIISYGKIYCGESIQLPEGTSRVKISAIISPDEIYVKVLDTGGQTEEVQEKFDLSLKAAPLLSVPSVGQPCAVKFQGTWYRAKILEVLDSGSSLLVQLVDFGNRVRADSRTTKQLEESLCDVPFFAVAVCLANVKPTAERWDPSVIPLIESFASKQPVTLESRGTYNEGRPCVELRNSDNQSLADVLVSERKARRPGCSKVPGISMKRRVASGTASIVHAESFREIYVHWRAADFEADFRELGILEEGLLNTAKLAAGSVKEGGFYACLFPLDSSWYRAQVVRSEGNKFTVRFVDYGNSCDVTLNELRELPCRLLEIPPCCGRVALNRVVECCDQSPEEMKTFFDGCIEQELEMTVVSDGGESDETLVEFSMNGVNINDLIINEFNPEVPEPNLVPNAAACSLEEVSIDSGKVSNSSLASSILSTVPCPKEDSPTPSVVASQSAPDATLHNIVPSTTPTTPTAVPASSATVLIPSDTVGKASHLSKSSTTPSVAGSDSTPDATVPDIASSNVATTPAAISASSVTVTHASDPPKSSTTASAAFVEQSDTPDYRSEEWQVVKRLYNPDDIFPLPDNEEVEVMVLNASQAPELIFVCRYDQNYFQQLCQLTEQIQKYCASPALAFKPQVLELCLVKHPAEEYWYRAMALDAEQSSYFCVDKGESVNIRSGRVMRIPQKFLQLPYAASWTKLKGFEIEEKSEGNAGERVRQLLPLGSLQKAVLVAREGEIGVIDVPSLAQILTDEGLM